MQIDRKLVKQTVMTSVYGVTFLGARDQIANRLWERKWSEDDKLVRQTATYLARVRHTFATSSLRGNQAAAHIDS